MQPCLLKIQSQTNARKLVMCWLMLCLMAVKASAMVSVGHLRCEYLDNPSGIDAVNPQLGWVLSSPNRGEKQSAYQILVASSMEKLESSAGDLWDSGKVLSNETVLIPYEGKPLASQEKCFWKVRAWNRDGQPSAWSQPASWSMGLLSPADWTAKWISDPILADPANRPLTPIHCYRSELASRPDVAKWIVLDLGSVKRLDSVDVIPARPRGQNWDFRTAMYPVRFKIESANNRDFSDSRVIVDKTDADVPNPRVDSCRFPFAAVTARYVRLTVTRLSCWDGQDYGLALGGIAVFDGAQSVGVGASVECSDSIESEFCSAKFLLESKAAVALADSPALAAGMKDTTLNSTVSRVPMLRREFDLSGKVRRAILSVSARGFYEVRINGQRVGDELLTPGYTDYGVRLQYQTYDVTGLLRKGKNAVGALLGYGWYAGHMNLSENRCIYGYFPQFLAQLNMEMKDGTQVTLGTDGQWRSTLDGPVRWSDLLDGEGYDCRREMPGWDLPGFDDHSWQPVWSQPRDGVPLVCDRCQPVRVIREFKPVAAREVKSGVYVFDLGQEITGWCRLKVNGPAGTHVRLRHAEMASPDGNIDVGTLMGTLQEEDYILDGNGERTLEPHFTYHGFRYVELSGLPGKLKPDTLVAVNLRTDAAVTGHFQCSDELYNRIQKAAAWTQANLLFDVPAGCAARSERLAWLGDIRPCVQSVLFNFDTAPLLTKYCGDMRDDQSPDGRFTDIAPHAHLRGTTTCVGSPGWADAGVSLPWEVFVNTGNKRLLAGHFAAAQHWVDVIHASNPDLLWRNNRGMDWGDWMSAGVETPKEIGATAFFAHSADLLSRMAQALGRQEEAERYQALFQGIRQAFVKNYVDDTGVIGGAASGQPAMRDVTGLVRSLAKNGKLSFTVNNDELGGDPAPQRIKNLHLIVRHGKESAEQSFIEGSQVEIGGQNDQPLEIISAAYGFDGSDLGDTQGSYALALQFGLLDEPLRSRAAQRLYELVAKNGHHPTTGFWSSVELLLSLSNSGYHKGAAAMLDQRGEPSWGYMADYNTTLWEAFDANTRNLSLNHWTHSAVSEWLYRDVAGINPDEQHPGYQSFTIHPRPSSEVTWCLASYDSIRGRIVSDWKYDGNKFWLEITVPANTTATVFVPATGPAVVTESGRPASQSEGVTWLQTEPGTVVYKLESGVYRFNSLISLI
jgi:alpha-L-rhamnosidase